MFQLGRYDDDDDDQYAEGEDEQQLGAHQSGQETLSGSDVLTCTSVQPLPLRPG